MQPNAPFRPARPTLSEAAQALRLIGGRREAVNWASDALPAVRAAIVAVEGELDALYARDAHGETVTQAEPRLIHAVEELQADLARQLVSLWETKEKSPEGVGKAQVAPLAHQLISLAERGLALVYESLARTDALD